MGAILLSNTEKREETENINIKRESAKLDIEIASKWQHSWNTESR